MLAGRCSPEFKHRFCVHYFLLSLATFSHTLFGSKLFQMDNVPGNKEHLERIQ